MCWKRHLPIDQKHTVCIFQIVIAPIFCINDIIWRKSRTAGIEEPHISKKVCLFHCSFCFTLKCHSIYYSTSHLMWRIGKRGTTQFPFLPWAQSPSSSPTADFFQSIKSTHFYLFLLCQEKLSVRHWMSVFMLLSLKSSSKTCSKSMIVDLGATISICSRKSTSMVPTE